jgi:hypothetical protein
MLLILRLLACDDIFANHSRLAEDGISTCLGLMASGNNSRSRCKIAEASSSVSCGG